MNTSDQQWLDRAIDLAKQGEGLVEPNPMVGCVIVKDGQKIGEGFHQKYGGPHAEINALGDCQESPEGATAYVSLEPCSHHGKTPPCTEALLDARIRRVVIGARDPSKKVNGQGILELRKAVCDVDVFRSLAAHDLIAPYTKLVTTGQPWVIAKWAMTLDGRMSTRSGDSKWISNKLSRKVAHLLRARMDAIVIGGQTARDDDPLLTARPPGPRVPLRVVMTSDPNFAIGKQLASTANEFPTLFTAGPTTDPATIDQLTGCGCSILNLTAENSSHWIEILMAELGRQEKTNVFVEGGATLLGSLFDLRMIDEIHVFVAPKLVGGGHATSALQSNGIELIKDALGLVLPQIEDLDGDVYISGRVNKTP